MTDVVATLKSINASSFKSNEERRAAVKEANALLSRIEAPAETSFRLIMTYPPQMACLKAAYDMELFQKWIQKNDGNVASIDELNGLVQCDSALFARLMRHLASSNMLRVDDRGMYEMTPFTIDLIKDNLASMLKYFFDMAMPLSLHLPTFLDNIGYQNPTENDKDCFKSWKNQSAWEYLAANPSIAKNIGEFMQTTSRQRGNFSETYPCEGLSCSENEVLIVDVGGSLGHDIQTFRSRFPNASGRLVLQDLPDVVQRARESKELDPSIETQAYDFFTPQLVTDAQIYLLHSVLHDWPDADAKRILNMLKPAMKKGRSKLLIHEVVMPLIGADVGETTRDLIMMYMASGLERTESQWAEIINAGGLKINKIRRSPLYVDAIIEVEVA